MVTILTEDGPQKVRADTAPAGALWLAPADVERLLGWTWKPEGLCRGSRCVPVSAQTRARYVRPDALDIAALWHRMGKPVRHSADASVWLLGAGASERTATLEALEAPDFTLPDLAGRRHSLSEHRGKKVLLATWASW